MHTGAPDHTSANHVHRRFFDRAVEICQKWGIPVIDLWNGCPLNPKLTVYYDSSIPKLESNAAGKYYTDGQHLTITGYKFIYPLIEAWMRNLYMNGDKSGGGSNKNSIYYIEGKSITAGTWLGTSEDITEYYDGLTIAYKTNVIGASGGTTLNINGLGAVSVVRNNNTVVSSQYVPGSILILTYTTDANGTSYWKIADYDDDKKTSSSNKVNAKMFLVGATSQNSNGVTTNTNSKCYIGADNCLYSNGEKVATGSGASVQSDWTQNDETAPDYVKGRTHWSETVKTILPETTFTLTNGQYQGQATLELETGKYYTVVFDGEEFILYASSMTYQNMPAIMLGNASSATSMPITDGPFISFVFGYVAIAGAFLIVDLSRLSEPAGTTHTFAIYENNMHTIPEKYLSNARLLVGFAIGTSDSGHTTIAYTNGADEVYNACMADRDVLIKLAALDDGDYYMYRLAKTETTSDGTSFIFKGYYNRGNTNVEITVKADKYDL
jgi:hypothetical protein